MSFSPYDYTYRTVKKTSSEVDSHVEYKTANQIPSSGFSGYFSVNYRIKTISIKTGLIVDRYRYSSGIVWDTIYNGKYHTVESVRPVFFDMDCILIGIPVRVESSIRLSRIFNLYAGVGANCYILKWSTENVGFTDKRGYSLNSTLGVNLKSGNSSFSIAPVYNHLITPFVDRNTAEGTSDHLFLYSLGIELGFNYTFNKRNRKN